VIWLAILIASIPLTLLVVGVRDWRCHAATLLAASTLAVLGSGALSSLLALGTALLWRYRDRRLAAVPLAACVVVAKIFLWPILLWFVATGRRRTGLEATLAVVAIALAGWAATGFAGFTHYPHQLAWTAGLEQGKGYTPVALGLALGLPAQMARIFAASLGVTVIAAMFAVARRENGERRSFALAIFAALLFTPIAWLHYFVLLIVPIALARPRFAPLWLAPIAFWLVPMRSEGDLRRIVIGLALCAAILIAAARTRKAPDATSWPSGARAGYAEA
jgi:hypothetical protein